jgi:hypothetical protein
MIEYDALMNKAKAIVDAYDEYGGYAADHRSVLRDRIEDMRKELPVTEDMIVARMIKAANNVLLRTSVASEHTTRYIKYRDMWLALGEAKV